jgi:hypothetical protein
MEKKPNFLPGIVGLILFAYVVTAFVLALGQ